MVKKIFPVLQAFCAITSTVYESWYSWFFVDTDSLIIARKPSSTLLQHVDSASGHSLHIAQHEFSGSYSWTSPQIHSLHDYILPQFLPQMLPSSSPLQ